MFDDRYNGLTLDEAAAKAGGYVDYVPGRSLILDYDYRAMSDYMTFAITTPGVSSSSSIYASMAIHLTRSCSSSKPSSSS